MNNDLSLNIDQTIKILSGIYNEYVWSVQCGEYGVLRLDFGSPHLRVREPSPSVGKSEKLAFALQRRSVIPTGKWHLFIELGFWNIEAGGFRCSRTDEPFDTRAFNQLDGQKLIAVDYVPAFDEWIFKFDLSGILSIKTQELDSKRDSQWILFFESGGCLSFDDSSHISLGE